MNAPGIYMADVTSLAHFSAGVVPFLTGEGYQEWAVGAAAGETDVALHAASDGVYMYAYVLHPNGKIGCVRVDCLAE